jgi:hypothetical protein
VRTLTFIFLVGLSTLGCAEVVDSSYADIKAATADGAIELGWIPAWTPELVTEILESHDLDTNQSMVAAIYDSSEVFEWQTDCKQIGSFDAPNPPFNKSWWPSDVPASKLLTYRHTYFKCSEREFAAWGQGEFYYWRPYGS